MIIKCSPDKEKSISIIKMIENRKNFVKTIDVKKFPTMAAESYYEIVKELATALLLVDGLKSIGENAHKDLMDYLSNYGFSEEEIFLMNGLRIKRNKSSYEGKQISKDYLLLKKQRFDKIIDKLKGVLEKRLR